MKVELPRRSCPTKYTLSPRDALFRLVSSTPSVPLMLEEGSKKEEFVGRGCQAPMIVDL